MVPQLTLAPLRADDKDLDNPVIRLPVRKDLLVLGQVVLADTLAALQAVQLALKHPDLMSLLSTESLQTLLVGLSFKAASRAAGFLGEG